MPFAAPGPCLPKKRPRPSKAEQAVNVKEENESSVNPTLQRLRTKLNTGCINPVERQMLGMLEQQSVAEVRTALAAKAAKRTAAREPDEVPMTTAQAQARFLCRAKQAEVAKAKARTQYVPEGPPVEGDYEEKSAVLQKRKHAEQVDSEWQFWNSYFQKVPTATARKAMAVKQQQQQRAKESAKGPPSDDEEDRLSDNADDDSDDDYCHRFYREEECPSDCTNPCDTSEYDSYSEDEHQCHCLSPLQNPSQGAFQLAFRQLVMFVKNLQDNVCNNPAAARLKTFATLQISNKQDLTSAARQIWLAVHPDKNHASDAQAASQDFGKLLDSLKAKSLL